MRNAAHDPVRPAPAGILFLLAFLSGLTGLVYQVLWMRMLSDALGVTVLAVVCVLAVFMGGLALGSWLFGRVVDRLRSPARLYGLLEIGIGASALAILPLLSHLTGLFDAAQRAHGFSFEWQVLGRILYSAAMLLPPTVLMGGTFPSLCRYLVPEGERDAGGAIGAVYGVNTLGGVAGAFLAGFVMIEALGIHRSVYLAASLNAAVGLAAILLFPGVRPPAREKGLAAGGGDASGRIVVPAVLFAATVSGFVSIGFEVLWSKALVFFIGNSTYAVSLTLVSFLFGIALGSFLFIRAEGRLRRPFEALGILEVAVAVAGALTVPVLCKLFYSATWLPLGVYFELTAARGVSWTSDILRIALTCLLVMLLPTTLMGVAFPLAASLCVRARKEVARALGNLYALNTLGSILGAILAGTVVIALFGVQRGILALASLNAIAGFVVLFVARPARRRRLLLFALLFASFAAGSARFLTLERGFRSENEGPEDRVLYYKEGIAGVVKVLEGPGGVRSMGVDGAVIGSTAFDLQQKQKVLAHVPALLARGNESVLAIGLGSGITLGSVGLHEGFRSIECVEIVPEVVEAAALFGGENRDVLRDPRTRILVDDGVIYMRTSTRFYDVISCDAKLNHSYVGNAAIFSRDYYLRALARLAPGGVMCQWVPTLLPTSEWKSVIRTFLSVFPHATLWFFEPMHAILAGSNEPFVVDPARIARAMEDEGVSRDLAPFGLDTPAAFIASFVASEDSLRRFVGDGPINSFERPTLEFRLPRALAGRELNLVEADNLEGVLAFAGDVRSLIPENTWASIGEEERAEIERSLEAAPLYFKGVAEYARRGQLVAGRGRFEQAAALAPRDGRIRLVVDRLLGEEERLGAQAQVSGDADAHFRLGIHKLEAGLYEEARAEFENALAIRPDHAGALVDLGAALQGLGRADEAIASWERAVALRPGDRTASINLAAALRARGEAERALRVLETCLLKGEEHPALRYQMAETYLALGMPDDARREGERAVRAAPENPRFREFMERLGRAGER